MNKSITTLTAVVMTVVLTAAFVPSVSAYAGGGGSGRGLGIPGRAITVITPNGGEVWKIGTVHRIEWSAVELGGPFTIEILGKGRRQPIKVSGNDHYDWRVTGPASPLTLVRVTTFDGGGKYTDISDMPFSIVS